MQVSFCAEKPRAHVHRPVGPPVRCYILEVRARTWGSRFGVQELVSEVLEFRAWGVGLRFGVQSWALVVRHKLPIFEVGGVPACQSRPRGSEARPGTHSTDAFITSTIGKP